MWKSKSCQNLKKILSLLLTITLSAPSYATGGDPSPEEYMGAVPPKACIDAKKDCACFYPAALDKIAGALIERDSLEFERDKYKKFAQSMESQGWTEDPTLVYAAIGASILLGGFVGYTVAKGL